MKRWGLAAIFVAGFATALASTVPATLVFSWLGADRIGISAGDISGSIWTGRLKAAQYRGISLGDIEVALDPLAFVTGVNRLGVRSALGKATLVEGDMRGVESADAAIEIERFHLALPLAGRLQLEGATLLFSGSRCARAEGRVVANLLERALGGPELKGGLSCAGEAAIARLEGRMQDFEVDMTLRLDADGHYEAQTRIASANPLVRGALSAAGFAQNGEGFVRSDQGELGA